MSEHEVAMAGREGVGLDQPASLPAAGDLSHGAAQLLPVGAGIRGLAPAHTICAGPARWMCTVGFGHLCGEDEVPRPSSLVPRGLREFLDEFAEWVEMGGEE